MALDISKAELQQMQEVAAKVEGGGEPLSVVSGSERHMDPNCQGTRRNSLKSFKRSSTRCVCAGPRLTRGLGRLEKSES